MVIVNPSFLISIPSMNFNGFDSSIVRIALRLRCAVAVWEMAGSVPEKIKKTNKFFIRKILIYTYVRLGLVVFDPP